MNRENDTMDAATIVQRCAAGYVPVNAPASSAIEAHRQSPGPNTLHAVITADTRKAADCRALIDYLSGLQSEAWRDEQFDERETEERRSLVLEMIRRSIAWAETCA